MDTLKLVSDKDVTYNDTRSTSKTVKMHGTIEEIHRNVALEITKIVYKYVDADGVVHSHETLTLTNAEMDALYTSVKANLPDIDAVGHSEYENYKYYEGMRIKMAERFSELAVGDITITVIPPPVEE